MLFIKVIHAGVNQKVYLRKLIRGNLRENGLFG